MTSDRNKELRLLYEDLMKLLEVFADLETKRILVIARRAIMLNREHEPLKNFATSIQLVSELPSGHRFHNLADEIRYIRSYLSDTSRAGAIRLRKLNTVARAVLRAIKNATPETMPNTH